MTEEKRILFESNPDVTLRTMKECHFRRMIMQDRELAQFCRQWDCTLDRGKKKKYGNSEMIQAIRDGKLFGVGVASVAVPTSWEGTGFSHPMSPQEYYEHFPPIFQTTLVGYEEVGPYMKKVIRENQMHDKREQVVKRHRERSRAKGEPIDTKALARDIAKIKFCPPPAQRLLVSVMESNRLVCSSDLLAWYSNHGMTVVLEEFLEYKPLVCFGPFAAKVTEARQKGNEVQAKTMKVK